MICNPVVKKSGGSQVFRITDNSGYRFPASAEAGERVEVDTDLTTGTLSIKDSSGKSIPYEKEAVKIGTDCFLFIMPASDITITTTGIVIDPGIVEFE